MQAQTLAQLVTHIPTKGESAGGGVRYYGFYSNKSRGLRKKAGTDDEVPALIDSDISRKDFRKNWARLIQRFCVYPDILDISSIIVVNSSSKLFRKFVSIILICSNKFTGKLFNLITKSSLVNPVFSCAEFNISPQENV